MDAKMRADTIREQLGQGFCFMVGKVSVRGEARREEHEGIYFDGLHDLFRRVTGLETRVPRIVGA